MRWHKEGLVCDGKLRHPADSLPWKHVDDKFKEFALDPRNVRLGLASNGFNPFGMLNVTYTTRPVKLIPYNLPPWLCLKQSYWMMSTLVPGPKSPGMNIDVYLQPPIDELKELWVKGVETWDAKVKKNFTLRARLLWTINDFHAYAMLSGWSTKGKFVCPYCHSETDHLWLNYGSKHYYMGHRRFLPSGHRWRRNKASFNNKTETRESPVPLSGDEVLVQYESFEQVTFGKESKKRKQRDEVNRWHNWRKKSIFFELPYWKTLLIRHNLDVMHAKKNVCESLLGTLLGLEGKSKDGEKARLDLEHMGIRKDLHLEIDKGKYKLPPSLYNLEKEDKQILCKFLQQVKMLDGYASNIRRCVDVTSCKITGVNSHDYHVMLQKLLPLVLRHLLPPATVIPLVQLIKFFNVICSKELEVTQLEELNKSIGETLCRLEMIFPLAFFDIMMHLPVHLAGEARLGGPVCYRWMYPVERYLRTLKGYVRNKAAPEGSIAEGYISEECLTFCSRFFDDVSTEENRPDRQIRSAVSEPPCGLTVFGSIDYNRAHDLDTVSHSVLQRMRQYILSNREKVTPWIMQHMDALKKTSTKNVEQRHKEQFVSWFEREEKGELADKELYSLARGPDHRVRLSNRCLINGFLFRTASIEKRPTTQNSGIVVRGDAGMEWYGVIDKIITLDFPDEKEIIVFECSWFDVPKENKDKSKGYKRDEYGIIDVDTTVHRFSEEPYILATQAEHVCFVKGAKKLSGAASLN
ncbi:uncharacterized protein LOC100825808 [Brachypodium distachyon]|uniref:uncharacterized protein LOC100825808 n=1 Tax=Brachypodium distachyon TaxID=15368 RepID=UPI000D0D16AC|nr:uncharacterized protein LOC100825808 [Brachypodium distachyon]|eukprot:XP_024314555.1 uncharacterized protein LOC100825808 [Brachypodium distachyon]